MATATDSAVTEKHTNRIEKTSQVVKTKKDSKPVTNEVMGVLFNRNKYPVLLDYGNPKNPTENLMLSPKQRMDKVVLSKLPSTLPKGVVFIPSKSKSDGDNT
jgi:hypothetical protein